MKIMNRKFNFIYSRILTTLCYLKLKSPQPNGTTLLSAVITLHKVFKVIKHSGWSRYCGRGQGMDLQKFTVTAEHEVLGF